MPLFSKKCLTFAIILEITRYYKKGPVKNNDMTKRYFLLLMSCLLMSLSALA